MLHLQENVALARKCCICKKIAHWQDFLSKTVAVQGCVTTLQRAVRFPTKLTGKNLAFARKCCIGKKMLHWQDFLVNKSCIGKKMLHLQDFLVNKSCIGKKMLHLQDFLVNATFSCKCNIFLPLNVKVLYVVSNVLYLRTIPLLFPQFSSWGYMKGPG